MYLVFCIQHHRSREQREKGNDHCRDGRFRRIFQYFGRRCKGSGSRRLPEWAWPFTVFAPTDEAFAKLPAGTLEELLKPENKAKLQGILTYHVVSGQVMAKDVVGLDSAKTVNGQTLSITQKDGAVMVDNAKVVKTDIVCSNGVIHVIDTVVLPK